jgi:potassium efflux system protein
MEQNNSINAVYTFSHDVYSQVLDLLLKSIFVINGTHISILKIIIAFSIFIFGFILGGFYKYYIRKIAKDRANISSSTSTILSNLGYYLIILIAFFIALNILGINLSSIALVAGALSVGIGFGLQNIVSNFVSGLILMFERSVKVGDFVELSDDLKGHIVDIRMRSTILQTNSNINVIVPNQNFIQNNVINWTMNDDIKRFDIPFGVAYGTKVDKVVEAILSAVEKSHFEDIYAEQGKVTRVVMVNMNSSSVDFELNVWIKGEEIFYPKRTTSRFLVLIYNALYDNGIEIPFPQLDLHFKNQPAS